MFIRQAGPVVQSLAPAKLNLSLEVLGKRGDGYHEIETLIVTINRFDTLTLRALETSRRIGLTCRAAWPRSTRAGAAPGMFALPPEEENLVYKALRLLQQRSGSHYGAEVTLAKRIPPASGLGGGSSDAAAALVAANRAWKLNWNREQLGEVAAELGSDVPFFLAPRSGRGAMMSVCRGRGEIVQPLTAPAGLHFVVARPATGLSTPVVYARCRTGGSSGQAEQLALALRRGDQRTAMSFMFNRLESAAAEISPGVEELATQFRGIGALAHQLSGSGSARFGWFASRRAAQRAALLLRAKGVGQVWQAQAI